ncbi:MAG: NAD+ synthase [Fimbriimonadaceae bacterium]|nr:NAD+ synthase [Fimbriimonadaceae bacterium]
MDLPVRRVPTGTAFDPLAVNAAAVANWLVEFLRDEIIRRRGMKRAIIGLSGGVDSAVTTYLCARAFGPENTFVFRMPYRLSSEESLTHAQLVIDDLGLPARTIDITGMVDGYRVPYESDADGTRVGNLCARVRALILFDQSAKLAGLPIGTGNKTERLFGYYTWHGDDAPPINPLGDLFKVQVWALARELGVPAPIVDKPPTADLIQGQTDEGDLGIGYPEADAILAWYVTGENEARLIQRGFRSDAVRLVMKRVEATHWKRHLPTVAMMSDTAINEYYLRPVDL